MYREKSASSTSQNIVCGWPIFQRPSRGRLRVVSGGLDYLNGFDDGFNLSKWPEPTSSWLWRPT
jgi:hypothetical protein